VAQRWVSADPAAERGAFGWAHDARRGGRGGQQVVGAPRLRGRNRRARRRWCGPGPSASRRTPDWTRPSCGNLAAVHRTGQKTRISGRGAVLRDDRNGAWRASPAAGPAPRPRPGRAPRPGSGGRRNAGGCPTPPWPPARRPRRRTDARDGARHDQSRCARDRRSSPPSACRTSVPPVNHATSAQPHPPTGGRPRSDTPPAGTTDGPGLLGARQNRTPASGASVKRPPSGVSDPSAAHLRASVCV
jgi:hypothetical protein